MSGDSKSRPPVPPKHDPSSPVVPPRTPGPLGRNDAADPNIAAAPGDTPRPLGVYDAVASSMTDSSFELTFILSELDGLSGAVASLALGEPLTAEEMWHVLLLRRALPLSIAASMVNTAPKRLEEIDKELPDLQRRFKKARGKPREMIKKQIENMLKEKLRLSRGQALGTFDKGTEAGIGKITYAGIQVVDSQGRRIALEYAETNSVEHAEEIIVRRLCDDHCETTHSGSIARRTDPRRGRSGSVWETLSTQIAHIRHGV